MYFNSQLTMVLKLIKEEESTSMFKRNQENYFRIWELPQRAFFGGEAHFDNLDMSK